MRYTKGNDWVEFKPGFCKLSMTKAIEAWSLPSGVAPWIAKCEFHDPDGGEVTITDGASIMDGLTFHQWDWLSEQLKAWARDDGIDPEA